jgi:rare lipoprotein A
MSAEDSGYNLKCKKIALKSFVCGSKNTSLLISCNHSYAMKIDCLRYIVLLLGFAVQYGNSAHAGNDSLRFEQDTVLKSRTGTASYYAAKFQGKHTSNGERLDNEAYTCASYLPYDTWIRVTHLRNGKSVIVRVTDRFRPGGKHLVDLTLRAAKDIDMVRYGVARIKMEVLNPALVRDFLPNDTVTVKLESPIGVPFVPIFVPDFRVGNVIH